jgi:hypothetical protein
MAFPTGWSCRIRGDQALLAGLAQAFAKGPYVVIKNGPDYLLLMIGHSESAIAYEIEENGDQIVRRMAALLNIFANLRGEIWTENAMYVYPDGRSKGIFASLPGEAIIWSREALDNLSLPVGEGTRAMSFLGRVNRDHSLLELLTEVGGGEIGWERLYKIYECIRKTKTFDTTQPEFKRFTQTANLRRHALNPRKYPAPRNPMSLAEAQDFIRKLLRKALEPLPESERGA